MGEWSSAGNMLQLNAGAPWFDAMPQEAWPDIEVHNVLHGLPFWCRDDMQCNALCARVKGGGGGQRRGEGGQTKHTQACQAACRRWLVAWH